MRASVILIGMPGAGKSTIGILLAKVAALGFVDTDVLIQSRTGERLQATLEREGYQALRRLEERVILELDPTPRVVATGGSAVYSAVAMAHLRRLGRIVFLEVSLASLRRRLRDFAERGIAGPPGLTLDQVYAERLPLYRQYAEVVLPCGERDAETLARELAVLVRPPS